MQGPDVLALPFAEMALNYDGPAKRCCLLLMLGCLIQRGGGHILTPFLVITYRNCHGSKKKIQRLRNPGLGNPRAFTKCHPGPSPKNPSSRPPKLAPTDLSSYYALLYVPIQGGEGTWDLEGFFFGGGKGGGDL